MYVRPPALLVPSWPPAHLKALHLRATHATQLDAYPHATSRLGSGVRCRCDPVSGCVYEFNAAACATGDRQTTADAAASGSDSASAGGKDGVTSARTLAASALVVSVLLVAMAVVLLLLGRSRQGKDTAYSSRRSRKAANEPVMLEEVEEERAMDVQNVTLMDGLTYSEVEASSLESVDPGGLDGVSTAPPEEMSRGSA